MRSLRPPALAGLAVFLAAVLAGCATPPPTEGTGDAVAMREVQFQPGVLRVPAGTTVTWTNHDGMLHTVTPADKTQWGTEGSGDDQARWMGKGATWRHTFAEPGTYDYYCIPHASKGSDGTWRGMVGTVIVE